MCFIGILKSILKNLKDIKICVLYKKESLECDFYIEKENCVIFFHLFVVNTLINLYHRWS